MDITKNQTAEWLIPKQKGFEEYAVQSAMQRGLDRGFLELGHDHG
jgi:hypothetical protein